VRFVQAPDASVITAGLLRMFAIAEGELKTIANQGSLHSGSRLTPKQGARL